MADDEAHGAAIVDAYTLFREVWLEGRLEEHLDFAYEPACAARRLAGVVDGAPLTYTKLNLARAYGRTARASGRGGGTAAPGRLLLRLAPSAVATMASRLRDGCVLVSATNGKTTTARMLAAMLEADGRRVVHNRAGANTHWGVGTALAEQHGEIGVFEVDEAWLGLLAAELRPRLVVLGNLFRDRLDGYGEVQRLVELWRSVVADGELRVRVVANADDALLAGPGGLLESAAVSPVLFGLGDGVPGTDGPEHPHEAQTCGLCGTRLAFERAFVGHLGHYRCPQCATKRPEPQVTAIAVREHGLDRTDATVAVGSSRGELSLALPGRHNVYNALAAVTAAHVLGVGDSAIQAGLARMSPPFGRGELIRLKDGDVRLMLVKNPVGMNETLRMLESHAPRRPLSLWLALNDEPADGRDVSWIWDCDFERLTRPLALARCSGHRAAELALRLKCAGWDAEIDVDEDLERSFRRALARAPHELIAMPTYTALLGLRGVLARLGEVPSDWGAARIA